MPRGDGKNKFYSKLELPKELMKLIKTYNRVWKPRALRGIKDVNNGSSS